MRTRPTRREAAMAAELRREKHGLSCPSCGSDYVFVRRTTPLGSFILRQRICRHCGFEGESVERWR